MKQIPLTKGQFALVDDEDFDFLMQWKWFAQTAHRETYYAARRDNVTKRVIFMHRAVNNTPDGKVTDHIDCNGLNNTRANLRTATQLQNLMNRSPQKGGTSPLKGAWLDTSAKTRKQWRSAIRLNGKLKYLGRFETEQEAADAYARAAQEHFGEFSRTEGVKL